MRKALPVRSLQLSNDPLRRIADTTQPHLASAIYKAFLRLRQAISVTAIYRGMMHGNLMGGEIQPKLDQFVAEMRATKIFLANSHMQAHALVAHRFRGTIQKAVVQFDLTALPEPTQSALDDYDFGLIRETTDDVRDTIAQVITRGIQQGWAPDKMARGIRDSIGLTQTQENAVANYRRLLETGSSDALDRQLRDARYDDTVQDHIDGIRALSPEQIDRLVDRYTDRYLAYRANTIARFESLRASNEGASDGIADAIDAGQLDPSQVTTNWMIAQDELTCDRCRSIIEIQPDGVPYGTPFTWATSPKTKRGHGQTGQIMVAPLHPDCRCTNTYSIVGLDQSFDDNLLEAA